MNNARSHDEWTVFLEMRPDQLKCFSFPSMCVYVSKIMLAFDQKLAVNFCAIIDLRGHEIFGGENLKCRCSFAVTDARGDYQHRRATLWSWVYSSDDGTGNYSNLIHTYTRLAMVEVVTGTLWSNGDHTFKIETTPPKMLICNWQKYVKLLVTLELQSFA